MPGDNTILRHWQTELQLFHKNLSLLREQMTAVAIHDLRVAVKKLRSYFKLYAVFFEKKISEEAFAKTKELFSIFGKHRNIEITRELLLFFAGKDQSALTSLLVYLQLLQDQIGENCRQAIQQYEKNELDNFIQQVQQDFENVTTEDLAGKIKKQIASSIEKIRHDMKRFKNKSHLIRKHLKDIFYWSKIFDEGVLFTRPELKTLSKILDHLGDIQDHEVLIGNLKYFRKTILSAGVAEYDRIKKIEAKARNKKDRLLEKADNLTKEWVNAQDASN